MGYDVDFLGTDVHLSAPTVLAALQDDLVLIESSPVIDYTHFSLAMSRSRRLARWVAWNIDGAALDFADSISRDGVDFRPDPRVPLAAQTLDEVYASNSLDRGHLARRSDLLWGPLPEASQANEDSFYFTNITPQRDTFNHSGAAGIWGELENALLESAKADEQRVNVFAGPVLAADDMPYRGLLVPRSFWKVVTYATGRRLVAHAFLLTQDLDGLEQVALDDFAVYEVTVADLINQTMGRLRPCPVRVHRSADTDAAAAAPPLRHRHCLVTEFDVAAAGTSG